MEILVTSSRNDSELYKLGEHDMFTYESLNYVSKFHLQYFSAVIVDYRDRDNRRLKHGMYPYFWYLQKPAKERISGHPFLQGLIFHEYSEKCGCHFVPWIVYNNIELLESFVGINVLNHCPF